MNLTEQKVLTKIEVDNLFPSQDGKFLTKLKLDLANLGHLFDC